MKRGEISYKIFLISFLFASFLFFLPAKVEGVCPLCTFAVGTGVGLCRFLGIDDTITGLWIGALIFSSGLWISNLLKKRVKMPYLDFFSLILVFLLVFFPLSWSKMIGIPGNTLWGIDKLFLGIIFGAFFFLLGVWTDKFLRHLHGGKVFFYYQKVLIPIFYLALASFSFYLLTC